MRLFSPQIYETDQVDYPLLRLGNYNTYTYTCAETASTGGLWGVLNLTLILQISSAAWYFQQVLQIYQQSDDQAGIESRYWWPEGRPGSGTDRTGGREVRRSEQNST